VHELVEVLDVQIESENDGFDEVHAQWVYHFFRSVGDRLRSSPSVLQTVRRRPNIHKTEEVPGMQPCVRAGGRSAAFLPVNCYLPSLTFRYLLFSRVCPAFSFFRTLFLTILTRNPPFVLFPADSFRYFMALYYIHLIRETRSLGFHLANPTGLRIAEANALWVGHKEGGMYCITSTAEGNVYKINV